MSPDVSIIVVTHNVRDLALECLRSIRDQPAGRCETDVWLVDNASTDGVRDAVRREFPDVHVIENDSNLGFTCANNQAVRASQGRYVFFLNPDTKVLGSCVATLAEFMDRHLEVGAVGGQIRDGRGGRQPDTARRFPHPLAMLAQESLIERMAPGLKPRLWAMPGWSPERRMPVDVLGGAMMFVRREALDAAGAFSEEFFMFYEDVELCRRLQRHGWQVWYLPEAEIVHYQNAASGQAPARTRLTLHRSERTFCQKCMREPEADFVRLCRILDLCVRTAMALLCAPVSARKRDMVRHNVRLIYEWATPLARE